MIGCRKQSAHLAYHGSRVTNTRKSHVIIGGQMNNSRVYLIRIILTISSFLKLSQIEKKIC